jgi:phosphatidate cytidylyltransferase
MKKFLQRILVFIIGLPLVVLIVVFLPQKNHLAANLVITLLSALGAAEFGAMINKQKQVLSPVEAAVLGALGPAAMSVTVSLHIQYLIWPAAFALGGSWLLVSRVFSRQDKVKDTLAYLSTGFSVMFYPGFFMMWIVRMTLMPRADMIILVFLLTVIASDSAAWAAGMLFGAGNRGIVPVSPNKSVAGFIGGLTAAVLVGLGSVFLIPGAFSSPRLPSLAAGCVLGLLSGGAAALGDLAESAMKRSSDIKDSGAIIPGRGGVLDTVDSISLAAPVYYAIYWLLFI